MYIKYTYNIDMPGDRLKYLSGSKEVEKFSVFILVSETSLCFYIVFVLLRGEN